MDLLFFKKWTFHYKIADLFFVRVVCLNLPNFLLATGLIHTCCIELYCAYAVLWEGLAREKFGKFTLFKHLTKKFSELIDQPKGY